MKDDGDLLVVGGLHGDEPTGIKVAEFMINRSELGLRAVFAHKKAAVKRRRYLETDLNRSFAALMPLSLEENIAEEIKPMLGKAGLVIDIHNTKAVGNTCAIVTCDPNQLHRAVCAAFGMNQLVVMPPSGSMIACYPEKSISIEISEKNMGEFSIKKIINVILKLQDGFDDVDNDMVIYKCVGKVTARTLKRLSLSKKQFDNFVGLEETEKEKLGLVMGEEYCPIFLHRDKPEIIAFSLLRKMKELGNKT